MWIYWLLLPSGLFLKSCCLTFCWVFYYGSHVFDFHEPFLDFFLIVVSCFMDIISSFRSLRILLLFWKFPLSAFICFFRIIFLSWSLLYWMLSLKCYHPWLSVFRNDLTPPKKKTPQTDQVEIIEHIYLWTTLITEFFSFEKMKYFMNLCVILAQGPC